MLARLHGDLARLGQSYQVRGARQLYHNRSEITVALARP
jgi:23S rRNA C2498 (ribose-2'-O)-methylase RlmM